MNKNFTKKIVSLASAVAIMGAVAVPAMAATPVTGTTNVFYSSDNFIAGPDGSSWGVKIPSGVVLSNAKKSVNGEQYGVKLVSTVPGKELNEVYKTLSVGATVMSTNGYKLKKVDGTTMAKYTYMLGDQTFTADDTTAQQVKTALDLNNATRQGTFTLTEAATEKGDYTDTLTFTFTQTAAEFVTTP